MTSKSVISSPPQADILAGNAATKSSSAHGTSSGSAQFDDEFHSALQDRSTTGRTDASKSSAAPASSTKVVKQQPPGSTNFTRDLQQSNPQTAASNAKVPTVPVTSTPAVTNATDDAAQAALLAAISKDASAATQTAVTNKTLSIGNGNDGSKDKKTKKSDSDIGTDADPGTSTGAPDLSVAASILELPVAQAPVPTAPVAASDSNTPAKSSDSPQGGQTLTPLPTLAAPAMATPSVNPAVTAAVPSSSAATGKESEAFSMLLTPKTAAAMTPQQSATTPQQNAAKEALAATTPENDGSAANPSANPAKATMNAASLADENASSQASDARKTVTSSATNGASATPSSLEQGSSTASPKGKAEDKEEAVAATAGTNDAAGNQQDFGGFGSAPDSFARETKVSGNTAPAAPATPTAETQDSAAAAPGSAKEVAIRLEGQSGQTINVKLVDQGGQVQVSVRSNDPAAATALRGDLSSLASNLDKAGWKPEITAVPGGSLMETVSQTRPSDRNNQDSPGGKQLDWQQQDTPKKRPSVSDLWDQLLTAQNT